MHPHGSTAQVFGNRWLSPVDGGYYRLRNNPARWWGDANRSERR
jgi:hypothetical protein